MRSLPRAAVRDPQSGAVVARIAVAYESRFSEYVRVATAIAGDPERGRDAVQDAFARAIAGCLAYRGDGPLEAWLWRAVTNAAHNQRRAAGPAVCAGAIEDEPRRLAGHHAEAPSPGLGSAADSRDSSGRRD